MSTLWKVVYKTYPEPGVRHDKEDVFLANGVAYPGQVRSHYDFGRGVRRFSEEDVVRIEELWDTFEDELPKELVEKHPDVGWMDWAHNPGWPTVCDDGTPVEDVIEQSRSQETDTDQ